VLYQQRVVQMLPEQNVEQVSACAVATPIPSNDASAIMIPSFFMLRISR